MIQGLYTPESIMQTEKSRKILSWYTRFDTFASYLTGEGTTIGLEWFHVYDQYFASISQANPTRVDYKLERMFSQCRLQGIEVAQLFTRFCNGGIAMEDFAHENEQMETKTRYWKHSIQPFLAHEDCVATVSSGSSQSAISQSTASTNVFTGHLWAVNYLVLDLMGLDAMHRYRTARFVTRQADPSLPDIALKICELFETIEVWPDRPEGAIFPAQASFGIACLFVPREEKYIGRCRQKLANSERSGYGDKRSSFLLPLQSPCF